jgi:hypothetical protein
MVNATLCDAFPEIVARSIRQFREPGAEELRSVHKAG